MTQKRLGFFTRLLDQTTAAERYRLAADQIVHAERHGFDSAWIAQHHFHEQEGGLPSPFPFLGFVAARTSRIRLGTGVVTLPMENAIRVAEDAAVVDLLSGGRLEVGVGTGATPASYEAFGFKAEERNDVFTRQLKVLRAAWSGEALGHDENRLYPAVQSLNQRVWYATFSVAGGERAGQAGDGLMLSRTQPRPESGFVELWDLQNPIIDRYLETLPKGVTPRIMASRTLYVADNRAEALKYAEVGLNRIVERFIASGHKVESRALPDLIRTFDTHVGTVEDVLESLDRDTALKRATDIVFQVHSVDPPHAQILRSIELTAEKVAPALGWAGPAAPVAEFRRLATA